MSKEIEERELRKIKPVPPLLPKQVGYILEQISDVCNIYFASQSLPESVDIPKNAPFYMDQIIEVLRSWDIVQD